MKEKSKLTLINFFFIISIFILLFSIYIFENAVKKVENYKENYKKEMGKKFDRDYLNFSKEVNSNDMGYFGEDTNNIIIFSKDYYIWNVREIAEHEIGHLIWYRDFNESQRNEYIKIYNQSTWFVSQYASTNVREDFAESYSYWVLERNRLNKEREDFMEMNVRRLI